MVFNVTQDDSLRVVNLLDLGAGIMSLKKIVSQQFHEFKVNVTLNYYPVDAFRRSNETIVCDFNEHEYPLKEVVQHNINILVCQGCFEYVYDKILFLKFLKATKKPVVLTYALGDSRTHIWVSPVKSVSEFNTLFQRTNLTVARQVKINSRNYLFLLR